MNEEELVKKYADMTPNSREIFEELSSLLPGGVGSQIRWFEPYPFYVVRGEGARVWDVDGNEYLDYVMAYGPLLFGHARPRSVIEAVKEQAEKGLVYGIPNTLKLDVVRLMKEMIPCAERIKFANTGTEAILYAIRIARAYTGRKKVLKFEGVFHGYSSEAWISVHPSVDVAGSYEDPKPIPDTAGILGEIAAETVISHWNDEDHFRRKLSEYRNELAAVVIAPVNTGSGVLPPKEGFLETVREETERHGIPLIFDEVITGFRLAKGGAQEYYNVVPDLAVYGKILGGGMPIGAICGREDIMNLTDPRKPRHPIAGTFTTNPMTMAAALALLREIVSANDLYRELNERTTKLVEGIRDALEKKDVDVFIGQVGSIFQIYFARGDLMNYRDTLKADKKRYRKLFLSLLVNGIFVTHRPYGRWYTSFSHTDADIDKTLQVIEGVAKELTEE